MTGPLFSWDNAAEITQPRLHVFLYGGTGAGKTISAASFPEPIILSPANENGVLSLMGRQIPFKRISGSKDILEAIDWLEATQAKDPNDLPGQTLVWDSISHYAELVIEEISSTRKGGMDMQGWGQLATHFRSVQQRLRNLDLHVVFTSLAEVLVNDTGGVIGGRPKLSGGAKEMLPSACDIVAYMDVRDSARQGAQPVYRCYTRPKSGYVARTRFPAIPSEMTIGLEPGQTLWDQIRPFVGGSSQ